MRCCLSSAGCSGFGEWDKHVSDEVFGFEGVAERMVEIDAVLVAAPDFGPGHVARDDEVLHDVMDSAFADTDEAGDFCHAHLRVLDHADEYVRVIGEKGPGWHDSEFGREVFGHSHHVSDLPAIREAEYRNFETLVAKHGSRSA